MSSNLKVNTILPSTGTSIGIGTAGGNTTISGAGTFLSDVSVAGDFQVPDVIKHEGDVNTKIRFPAADTVSIETAGSERLRIDSSGKLGVNVTSPSAQLHVENDNANASTYYFNTDAALLIQNKNSNASAKTVLKLEGPVGGGDCAIVYGDSTANLIFSDRQNERLRITSDGVLKLTGQTTSIETAGLTYHTNGNLYIRGGTTGAVLQSVDGNESWVVQNDYVSASTLGSERLRITSGGNVNIGGNYTQTGYILSSRGGASDQTVQLSNTKSTNGDIHYFGITLTNAGYGQALFGHTGHTTQSEQAAWIGLAGDDVAGGVGIKCFRGGNVIKKGTCAFQAYNGSSQINQYSYITFTTTAYNIGGNYNTSNGIFTAPIAGRYLFTLTGLYTKNNSSATFKLTWHVNNANSGVASEYQTSSLNGSYNTIGVSSIIFQLSANDTVRLYVEGVGAYHISGAQTRYSGYLLG